MKHIKKGQQANTLDALGLRSERLVKTGAAFAAAALVSVIVGFAVRAIHHLKGPYEPLSRLQLSTQLLEPLDLPQDALNNGLESVLVYVGHSGLVGLALNFSVMVSLIVAMVVCIIFCFNWLVDEHAGGRPWMQPLLLAVTFGACILAVVSTVVFVAAPNVVKTYAYESDNHTSLSVRQSRHISRTMDRRYSGLIDTLEQARATESGYLPAQYAIAQLAHRVGAEDAHRQTVAFLEAYENAPERLGFEPVPQHLYSLETAAYGAPRSAVAMEYVEERRMRQGSLGIIARLWTWLAGILSMVGTFLLLMGVSLGQRHARLARMAGGTPPKG